ncbi:hypothetical protein L1987_59887 [Smallanthus sonchifolius]|uniref:Uncharacterized protein n=1 Tax=Smallanthus sonchifolius TaxID=185202 RepID=A0ACB9D6K7_9ASTR|nr:hypothetical protein L1987_59887 [Smallanthus sonchifolius]
MVVVLWCWRVGGCLVVAVEVAACGVGEGGREVEEDEVSILDLDLKSTTFVIDEVDRFPIRSLVMPSWHHTRVGNAKFSSNVELMIVAITSHSKMNTTAYKQSFARNN